MKRVIWTAAAGFILSLQLFVSQAEATQRKVWRSVASEAQEQAEAEEDEVDFPVLDTDGDGIRDDVEISGGCASISLDAGFLLLGTALVFLRTRRRLK